MTKARGTAVGVLILLTVAIGGVLYAAAPQQAANVYTMTAGERLTLDCPGGALHVEFDFAAPQQSVVVCVAGTVTAVPTETTSATAVPTSTPTATPTAEPTVTATFLPTVTVSYTPSATAAPTDTATPQPTATATLTPTVTATPSPTPDASARGNVVAIGDQWGWEDGTTFTPALVMFGRPSDYWDGTAVDVAMIDAELDRLMTGHGFNGVHVFVACEWWDIATTDGEVYARGGMVHLWMYGDRERDQNPADYFGFNSPTELAAINEIGARLAPLDGWTMGYGFDLFEWADTPQIQQWESNMRAAMGDNLHMLGARGCKNSYACDWSPTLDYYAVEWHMPTCQDFQDHVANANGRPVMSEDRFRVRDEGRAKDPTEAETLQLMQDAHACGGVGAIYGQLITPGGAYGDISGDYGNAAAIKAELEAQQ